MCTPQTTLPRELEGIPNIGKAIAADLRCIGILTPAQLAEREPLATYRALTGSMGQRHDPCVLYTLIAADHFLRHGETIPWWKFTGAGRELLKKSS
jgi:DNA transformation protein